MKRTIFWMLAACCCLAAGCHAPMPNVRGLFSAAGPTRIAPPATDSYTAADPYYSEQGGGAPPRASTTPVGTAPPYQVPAPAAAADSTSLSPPAGSSSGAVPRVRISAAAAQGAAFTSPQGGPQPRGMVATELSGQTSTFNSSAGMLEISQLPSAPRSPSAIVLPGTVNTLPRNAPPAPRPRVASGGDWQTRPQ